MSTIVSRHSCSDVVPPSYLLGPAGSFLKSFLLLYFFVNMKA